MFSYSHVSFASNDKKFEELEKKIKVLEDNLKKKSKELENSIFNEISFLKKTVEDKDLEMSNFSKKLENFEKKSKMTFKILKGKMMNWRENWLNNNKI